MRPIAIISALFFLICVPGFGQTDIEAIQKVLNTFIYGTTYNYPDSVSSTFYPDTRMFLYNGSDTAFVMSSEQYASGYGRRTPGTQNSRSSKILDIEVVRDVAYAKLQVDIPPYGNRYTDLLLMKRIKGKWKIVAKATSAGPIPSRPSVPKKEVVLTGLNKPWSIAFLSEEEVIIAEKDGDLIKTNLHTKRREVIKGLPDDVARAVLIDTVKHTNGVFPAAAHGKTLSYNAGWFQVLLDPDFENNHYIYISYAAENKQKQSATKVIRGVLRGNALSKVETLFEAAPYSHGLFHYGGGMIFGHDGKLYIATGERNFYEHLNPKLPFAQDVSDRRGKIFRLNPDGSIPDDNPNFGSDAVSGLYSLGIRAAQGMTIDTRTGKIWFSEHGTIQGDELNILEAGANYGWPNRTTGGYRTKNYKPAEVEGALYKDPIHFWENTVAPTGLVFYNGSEFPEWRNSFIVPGLSKGSLWRVATENDQVISSEELFMNDRVRLRKAALSPAGKLYLLTDEEDGQLIRVINQNR